MTFRSTLRWRHLRKVRWVVLATALPVLWACNSRTLEQPQATPTRTFNNTFQETVNRDLDILFMIDDSLSMQPLEDKLLMNFPVFMQALNGFPMGLPNVHIAVVSQDMGAGKFAVPQCAIGGDQGIFQSSARGTCTATNLQAGATYISNINGMANYTGKIEDVFTCIANLGQMGCGFEAQFASTVRALGADNYDGQGNPQPPPENAGFLRKNAYLAIIMITNEDDCSVPPDSALFDPGSRLVSDPLGPLASFRCNEYGHLCNGMKPPRNMAVDYPAGACTSAEDGVLKTVAETVLQIKMLKADPSKILVAVIGGFPDPYGIELVAPMVRDDPNMWPQVKHSCMQNSGEYADPGVRLAQFVSAFGANGLYLSICAPSFAPALMNIANAIGKVIGPKCVVGKLVDTDGMPGDPVVPDCSVIDHTFDNAGNQVDSVVPSCASNGSQAPCWSLGTDAMNCPTLPDGTPQHVLNVMRPAGNQPSDLNSSLSCSVCINNTDPGCNY
jgi:hypothetical protein